MLGEEPSQPPLGRRYLSTAGARIVVADDNADMRDYLSRLLSPHYEIECVADGEQALEAVRRSKPSLLLSDVMMPRLDGFGLLRHVRADPDLHAIAFILLSARAGEEARIEGLDAGADDYLVKPFTGRELLARVGGVIALDRLRRVGEEQLRLGLARAKMLKLSSAVSFPRRTATSHGERRLAPCITPRSVTEPQP